MSRELDALREIKKLASDPFASEAVALRACLLAANEALGYPGPEPSPERDIARALIQEQERGHAAVLAVVERYGRVWAKDTDYYRAAEALGIKEPPDA
jgi:hypothetical protein